MSCGKGTSRNDGAAILVARLGEGMMTKIAPLTIKGAGYLVSTVSVILLATVSWKGASQNPVLSACLLAGAATSIIGMCLRWASYVIEKRQKAKSTPDRP